MVICWQSWRVRDVSVFDMTSFAKNLASLQMLLKISNSYVMDVPLSPNHERDFLADDPSSSVESDAEFEEDPQEEPEEEFEGIRRGSPKLDLLITNPHPYPPLSESSSDTKDVAYIVASGALKMPPSGSTFEVGGPSSVSLFPLSYLHGREIVRLNDNTEILFNNVNYLERCEKKRQAEMDTNSSKIHKFKRRMDNFNRDVGHEVSERFGRGAMDARPDDGVDGSAAFGESQPPKLPGSPSGSQIMPPKMIKRKAVKKIVKKQIAEAIEEYEKTRANPGNAGGSGPGVVGLRRWIEKVEKVFEIYKCAEEDKVVFAASTFEGYALTWWNGNVHTLGLITSNRVDIEAYNNHFHELAFMCLDLVSNEKKKVERLHGFLEVTAAQIQDYALWEVIENGNSWVPISQTTEENGIPVTKMSTPATAEEKTKKKNDVKARDAKSMFAAIKTRFGGNAATKKTQKTLLKQQYENFSATSAESLDSIFNRLQKIVSRLAILGVIIAQEDLNLKILSSLPPEWNTHVVVWMNKPEVKTMSIDDLYNNFKIVKQKVKKTVGISSGVQNLAFMTTPSSSSTNDANTTSSQVSATSPSVNTAKQIHEDDLEVMDLKWQLSLLSMREKKYYQRTCKKIFINGNDIAGYDKPKVECYNYHKLGHFSRECRAPRSKEGQFRNQDNTRKQGNNKDTSKAMLAIDGVARKSAIDFKIEKFGKASKDLDQLLGKSDNWTKVNGFGYSAVPLPHPLIYNRPNKLDLSYSGLDEFKEPEFKGYGHENNNKKSNVVCDKESENFKDNSVKSLVEEQVSQVKSSFVEGCGSNTSKSVSEVEPKKVRKNNDAPIIEDWVSDDEEQDESKTKPEKKTVIPTAAKIEKPVKKSVRHFNHKVNTVRPRIVNTARSYRTPVNTIRPRIVNTARTYRTPVNTIRPKVVNTSRPNRTSVNAARANGFNSGKPQLDDKGFVDSGCSRHMTGNIAYLSDFKQFDRGYVAFGGGAYGGKISSKGTLKTDNLDFEDVYFVNELKFNLFSVSQMCDKKNYVLFTDTECLVLSQNVTPPEWVAAE
ncbi:ribonuclease H-like domain-containing protein [Tanacetum coccineum]